MLQLFLPKSTPRMRMSFMPPSYRHPVMVEERGGPFHKGGLRLIVRLRCRKVVGCKRHILTDTLGLLLAVNVHSASVQDRDGAEALLREARRSFPFVERIIGDAGYQGRKTEAAVARTVSGSFRSSAAATATASSSSR